MAKSSLYTSRHKLDELIVTVYTFKPRSKKVPVPASAISRVIGRGGCNINAIREVSGANIDVEKNKGSSGERIITIKLVKY